MPKACIFLTTFFICLGCHTKAPPATSTVPVPEVQLGVIPATNVQSAEAEAIMVSLKKTTILQKLPSYCGAIFFENVAGTTLVLLRTYYGEALPRLEETPTDLDREGFFDKRTKKPALLVKTELVRDAPDAPAFRIVKRTDGRGWVSCYIEMHKQDNRWEIARCLEGIAD